MVVFPYGSHDSTRPFVAALAVTMVSAVWGVAVLVSQRTWTILAAIVTAWVGTVSVVFWIVLRR